MLPPNMILLVNFQAVHNSPAYWGADSTQWKPQRWIRNVSGQETLVGAPEGSEFIAWACGPRICPGKKFSQVEFIAVLATILQSYRIRLATKPGESFVQARDRTIGVMEDSILNLSVRMVRPDDAALVLEKR
jgi:cytochrome P450